MIQPHEITIGCLLRTNKGEVIRVESISTKRQHRKIGYHPQGDSTHIKYVRLGQVEGIELTTEICNKNLLKYNEHDGLSLRICGEGPLYISFGCIRDIKYVHEVQMAMYLCGWKDKADNFEV